MTAGSSSSNAITCTIQPKIRGKKRPPTVAHASAVAIGDLGPKTGFPSRVSRQRRAAEQGLIARDNQFAFTLFGESARQAGPDSNLFISPLSAAMALGMAYDGATGITQAEMQRTLELDGMTLDDVNQSYRALIALLR